MVGLNAGDVIAESVLAIEKGADATDIGATIHPHPPLSECSAWWRKCSRARSPT
jgi:dihydrolipoamide dehydrogenase